MLIVFVLGLLNFIWGEKIPAGGGFGWDGVHYADMVRNLDSMISGGHLSNYYAHRILPSLTVRGMLLLFDMPMSNLSIIRSFEVYNLVLLVGACWSWTCISKRLALSNAGSWIGFSGIFINFQSSKQAFYYPVLTDVTALFLATLLLLFYVEKKPGAIFLATIIGSFCWPGVSITGALLLIFLKSILPKEVISQVPSSFPIESLRLPYLIKFSILVGLILAIIYYMVLTQLEPVTEHACNEIDNQLKILANAMLPSVVPSSEQLLNRIGPCALKLFTGLKSLLTGLPALFSVLIALVALAGSGTLFRGIFTNLWTAPFQLVIMAISAIILPMFIVDIISNPALNNPNTFTSLIRMVLFPPMGKFLLPIVSLTVCWGPVVLLLVLHWEAFCVEIRKLGLGAVAVVGIHLPLGLLSEGRFVTIAWPFFVLGLVLAMESIKTKESFKYLFAALTILYAQFWLKLNLAPWSSGELDGLFVFPKQLFMMHYGWWMSSWTYLLHLPILVLSAVLLHKVMIRAP